MFAPFDKFNMAAVNSRFLLAQRKRRQERQITHKCWVREIFQKREFKYFAVGNAVHPGILAVATIATIAGEWFPYDRYDRSDHMETSL